jgi:PncC family amidohydrolase
MLRARQETVAVAESSAGGLVAAALLAVPGASAYFVGGATVYTGQAKRQLIDMTEEELAAARPATEQHALLMAAAARRRLNAAWGIGETGAAGPTGNRYGDPPGHACIAVSHRDGRAAATTVRTGSDDRLANMVAFATAALRLLASATSPQ